MNTLLLQPTDVLFFRDGRPMNGSLAGHSAAWPLPDITNHALHAALHRAAFDSVHLHRRGRSGNYSIDPNERDREFGSLLTAGPFPVGPGGRWFWPRPKDAQQAGSVAVTLQPGYPLTQSIDAGWHGSSLPKPLQYSVGNIRPPEKGSGVEPWISTDAFNAYLRDPDAELEAGVGAHFLPDESLADMEANVGIAIDPETQAAGQGAAAGKIYTANYLRLREGYRLGVLAKAEDKGLAGNDLIRALLNGQPAQIVVGGQQRVCTAEISKSVGNLPLPVGLSAGAEFHKLSSGKYGLKWVLLAPAIWPELPEGTSQRGTKTRFHPGGWLPNWVCPDTGAILLRTVSQAERRRRRTLNSEGRGYATDINATEICARLVAAIVPKPLVVTGWALPNAADPTRAADGGAKSTHLAVPPGAVYHFEADSAQDAAALANALNWHGATNGTAIKNRRSTLLGEKGYGLGVCGTWKPFGDVR